MQVPVFLRTFRKRHLCYNPFIMIMRTNPEFIEGKREAALPTLMSRRTWTMARSAIGGVLLAAAGCGGDCLQIPCPQPLAVEAVVTSATGLSLTGLLVDVSTPTIARIPCNDALGRCTVPGSAGSYTLRFSAPGHQALQRNVTVARVRAEGSCGCEGVTTQQLQVTLVPL
jgi:hypothetical protein